MVLASLFFIYRMSELTRVERDPGTTAAGDRGQRLHRPELARDVRGAGEHDEDGRSRPAPG